MTHTHTPSPWRVETWTYQNAREVLTIQTDKDAIAQMCGLWREGDDSANEVAANARLIAAAPSLLNALIAIKTQAELTALTFPNAPGRGDLLTIARIAGDEIAKAEGKA